MSLASSSAICSSEMSLPIACQGGAGNAQVRVIRARAGAGGAVGAIGAVGAVGAGARSCGHRAKVAVGGGAPGSPPCAH